MGLVRDFRFAGRLLLRDIRFTAVAVLVLACGIAVNSTLFSIAYAICVRGLPIEAPDRVMYVATRDAGGRPLGMSYADFEDVRRALDAFDGLAAFTAAPVALGAEERAAVRATSAYVSANALGVVREEPLLGRAFRPDDDRVGAAPVVIISHGLWTHYFAAADAAIGREVRIDGRPATVIGVMPPHFQFPGNADLWQPLAGLNGVVTAPREARRLGVIGRLVDGVTVGQATARATTLATRLAGDYPDANHGIQITVEPINDHYNGRLTDSTWLAFLTVGALSLLIACANVASLLLARGIKRSREMAIRISLGASRGQVLRQLAAESGLLALAATAIGLALSVGALQLFTTSLPQGAFPYWIQFAIDTRVFAILAAVGVSTVVVFGLIPALNVSRADKSGTLKDDGYSIASAGNARRWTTVFLALDVGLTFVLLSYVAVTVQSYRQVDRADLVIEQGGLLTMRLSLPAQAYGATADRIALFDQLVERLGRLPGVTSVGLASVLPFGTAPMRPYRIDGMEGDRSDQEVATIAVDPGYFTTLRLPITEGRPFGKLDGQPGSEAAIVNDRFAALFSGSSVVGRRLRFPSRPGDESAPWVTIVGISRSVRQGDTVIPVPVVYLPARAAAPPLIAVMVRASADPASLTSAAREEIRQLDANLPLFRPMTMEAHLRESRWLARVSGVMISVIALVALVIACVGLYAVASQSVSQRTREIAIHMAVGATPWRVRWVVLRGALAQVGIGVVVGVVSTFAWQRAFLEGRPDRDLTQPFSLIAVAVLLVAAALAGSFLPANRATRVDPNVALRES